MLVTTGLPGSMFLLVFFFFNEAQVALRPLVFRKFFYGLEVAIAQVAVQIASSLSPNGGLVLPTVQVLGSRRLRVERYVAQFALGVVGLAKVLVLLLRGAGLGDSGRYG